MICVPSFLTVSPCPSGHAPEGLASPDVLSGADYFVWSFCFVFSVWLVAKVCGLILEGVRRW